MLSPLPVSVARRKGLRLVMLGSVIFALFVFMPTSDNTGMIDFMAHYFPARTLVDHSDPYNADNVLREYLAQRGGHHEVPLMRGVATHYPYPPTLFLLTVPFGMLPFSLAQILWAVVSVAGMIVASFLILDLGSQYAPRISGALIAFMLVNGETLAESGTVSTLAIGLSAISAWCFLKGKMSAVGVLCLGASLVLKPQEGGLIWLYFLLAGRVYRERALQALLVATLLSLPSVLWVTRVAPDWPREMARYIAGGTAGGGILDPGPSSIATPGSMVNFQVVASLWRNDPRFYNPATYMICGSLIAIWAFFTVRSDSLADAWLALAAIAALSLLVVYHRRYDTKLLLLAVPACAKLWAAGGRIGRIALGITGTAILFTGDGLWIFLSRLLERLPSSQATLFHFLQTTFIVIPAPVSLVAVSLFYLWVYMRRVQEPEAGVPGASTV